MAEILKNVVVTLDKATHTYTDNYGRTYESVSKVLGRFKPEFDPDGRILRAKAAQLGKSTEQLRGEWNKMRDDSCDHGTRIHDALELYSNEFKIQPVNAEMEDMLKSVNSFFSDYSRVYNEKVLFSQKYMVAGTTDKLCQWTSRADSIIDIFDFKTNVRRGIEFVDRYKKFMHEPVEHLMNCNYNHYSLQTSLYAVLYEEMTGCRMGRSGLVYIPETFNEWKFIPTAYLKTEAVAILNKYALSAIETKELLSKDKSGDRFIFGCDPVSTSVSKGAVFVSYVSYPFEDAQVMDDDRAF